MPADRIKNESLSKFRLFADLSESEIDAFVRLSSVASYADGEKIIRQGEEGYCMYVLLEGKVGIVADGTSIATLCEGDFFGEISLVDDGPRAADVVAEGRCRLLVITRMTLGILAGTHPDAAIHLLAAIGRSLVAKLRAGNKRFRELILLGSKNP